MDKTWLVDKERLQMERLQKKRERKHYFILFFIIIFFLAEKGRMKKKKMKFCINPLLVRSYACIILLHRFLIFVYL
jgi:putative effector of murein hydrolase